ncbi:hypothetical protein CR513_01861, partial [Mucuna pruriens]
MICILSICHKAIFLKVKFQENKVLTTENQREVSSHVTKFNPTDKKFSFDYILGTPSVASNTSAHVEDEEKRSELKYKSTTEETNSSPTWEVSVKNPTWKFLHVNEIEALRQENDELQAQFRCISVSHTTTCQVEQIGETDAQDARSTEVMNRHSTPIRPTPKVPRVRQQLLVDVNLRQGESEPLHSFIAQFSNISVKIRNLNLEVALHSMLHGVEAGAVLQQFVQIATHKHGQSKDKGLLLHPNGRDG